MGPSEDDGPNARHHDADMDSNQSTTLSRINAAINRAAQSPSFGFFLRPATVGGPGAVGAASVVWFAHWLGDRVRRRHPAARPVFASVALVAVALSLVGCAAGPTVAGVSESSLDPGLPRITAHNIAFVTTSLILTGSGPHEVAFDNQDTAPHNIGVYDAQGSEVFKGGIITGPAGIEYDLPALPAGTYEFKCDVHPQMTGTLVVA
jgi:hypothetical protein